MLKNDKNAVDLLVNAAESITGTKVNMALKDNNSIYKEAKALYDKCFGNTKSSFSVEDIANLLGDLDNIENHQEKASILAAIKQSNPNDLEIRLAMSQALRGNQGKYTRY